MLKNFIIAVSLVAVIFLVLHGIMLIRGDKFIDRNFSSIYRSDRIKAVEDSPTIKIAVVYGNKIWINRITVNSIKAVISKINHQGGIKGKQIELIEEDGADDLITAMAKVQSKCAPIDVAVCIGPFASSLVPSARALATFAAVPLVSPITVYSEKLRPINGDTYVAAFPELNIIVQSTINHMKFHHVDDLLILTPESGSYGDLYASILERYGQELGGFKTIHRLVYQSPFNELAMKRSIKTMVDNNDFDAIFYAGQVEDFKNFMNVYYSLNSNMPIYGTELLHNPHVKNDGYIGHIYIPFFNTNYLQNKIDLKYKVPLNENNPDLSFMGVWTMDMIAQYLETSSYDPYSMVSYLKNQFNHVYETTNSREAFFIDDLLTNTTTLTY